MSGKATRFKTPAIFIRAIIANCWSQFSIGLYSIPCIVVSLFSRNAAYAIGRLWSRHVLAVGGVRLEIRGKENLDPTKEYTFLSNHQSQLDIMALMSGTPRRLAFLAKKELFRTLFFGWGITALGMIPIDRRSPRRVRESFTRAAERVRAEPFSLLIFPEGTRSPDGRLQAFKQGSFTLVLEAGLEVVPVSIQGSHRILPKGVFGMIPGTITLTFAKPFDPRKYSAQQKQEISREVYAQITAMVQHPQETQAQD
ncbi:1-acyl-sn-glycerol-3-phosphate acyltransferase [bacterium]|nr:1-acyl-sn-glycerol-3-phosphate acyltransferase [bacterium]